MTTFFPAARIAVVLFLLSVLVFTFQSCKEKQSEDTIFFVNNTKNKLFENYKPAAFAKVFKQMLVQQKGSIRQSDFIINYYKKNNYEPELVLAHLFSDDFDTMADYFAKATDHGLNPAIFQGEKLRSLVAEFNSKGSVKTIDDAYNLIARIEILAANSLINYSNALQYGVINPKNIYSRYFTATKRPDVNFMGHVFDVDNVQAYLDSIQPRSPDYVALQKALKSGFTASDRSPEETRRMLLINLERLRWRNKPFEQRYVIVNIPDYYLNLIDSGHSVLSMKVCVGQGRNMRNENTLVAYNDSCRQDKPGDHETPLLNSLIHSVDVNPIWNIPRSIANKEILVEAANDRFYLSNKNIAVYQNDKLVEDPENIDWTTVTKENSTYEFKQNPGEGNSLGKIKFLFKNRSSVYLHDTPVKSAFYKKMRAVSHGCVRLGDPQGLALCLFGQGEKYELITKDMAEDNPQPTSVYLTKKTPVYITYVTCWPDTNGELQFRNDVYGHDIVLYDHMLKYIQLQQTAN